VKINLVNNYNSQFTHGTIDSDCDLFDHILSRSLASLSFKSANLIQKTVNCNLRDVCEDTSKRTNGPYNNSFVLFNGHSSRCSVRTGKRKIIRFLLTLSAIPAEVIGHPSISITLSVPKALRRCPCA
jgi:hypothetical protein